MARINAAIMKEGLIANLFFVAKKLTGGINS
jgi:hypothetical protein